DEYELPMALREPLDGEFAIDDGNDDAAISGGQSAVYNQHIARVNASFTHRLPSHPDKESCCRMLNEMLVEVQGAIEVIISGGRISSRDGYQAYQASVSCREVRRSHYVHVHRYSLPR